MSDMSFLPEDYIDRRVEQRTNLICLTLFLVMLGSIVGAYLITNQQRTQIRRQQLEINGQFQEAAARLSQLEQLQQRKRDMIRKARVTAELVETVPRTLILSELINNMPTQLSLLSLDLETQTVKAAAARPTTSLDLAKKQRRGAGPDPADPVGPEESPGRTDVKVHLVGVAQTDVEVAQFMYAIGQCTLFRDVNLSFSEQVELEEKTLRKFQIDMRLSQDVRVEKLEPKQVPRLRRNPMGPRTTDALAPGLPSGAAGAAAVSDAGGGRR